MNLKYYDLTSKNYFIKESNGTFAVFITEKNTSMGVYFPSSLTKILLDTAHKYIFDKLNHRITQIKIIGPQSSIDTSLEWTKENSLELISKAERQTGFELFFVPETGKVKLSKESSAVQKLTLLSNNENKFLTRKIKVLVVDDSKSVRQLLTKIFSSDEQLEVVATAEKPSEAEALYLKHKPDVMTLDIHMPEMDGATFLKTFLIKHSVPVVMISSISLEEGPLVLQALENGAVDYIQKPSFDKLAETTPLIIEKVKNAASARVLRRHKNEKIVRMNYTPSAEGIDPRKIIAIGSSTGGTEALKDVLTALPNQIPPIVIVQHIPPVFSKAFADRMNQLCEFEVLEAKDGDLLLPNRVLVAPGALQMSIKPMGDQFRVLIEDAPPVNRHKPSVDVLFDSVAKYKGKDAVGVILTGMGGDGAKGMLNMKNAGSYNVAQDEESCVVFGMPKEAIKLNAHHKILPLNQIAQEIFQACLRKKIKAA